MTPRACFFICVISCITYGVGKEVTTFCQRLQKLNLATQDAVHLIKKAHDENCSQYSLGSTKIILLNNQNILTLKADAIVNAANPPCLGGGGIDGAISSVGGQRLYNARLALPVKDGIRCPTGDARLTISGDITNAPFAIHAVGPDCRDIKEPLEQQQLLSETYLNSLKLIDSWNKRDASKHIEFHAIPSFRNATTTITSVAFPVISGAIYACNLQKHMPEVLAKIIEHLKNNKNSTLDTIYFVFYVPGDAAAATETFNLYKTILDQLADR